MAGKTNVTTSTASALFPMTPDAYRIAEQLSVNIDSEWREPCTKALARYPQRALQIALDHGWRIESVSSYEDFLKRIHETEPRARERFKDATELREAMAGGVTLPQQRVVFILNDPAEALRMTPVGILAHEFAHVVNWIGKTLYWRDFERELIERIVKAECLDGEDRVREAVASCYAQSNPREIFAEGVRALMGYRSFGCSHDGAKDPDNYAREAPITFQFVREVLDTVATGRSEKAA